MSVDHVKSIAITSLDTPFATVPAPAFISTAGEGSVGVLKMIDGYVTAVASSSINATYQLVRVPSNVKVKAIVLESEAQGQGSFDIGVYYATDGSNALSVTGGLLAAAAISQAFFASAVDLTSAYGPTNVTNESGTNVIAKRFQPLWQAIGLTTDPGGNFDIVATVTTAVTTGTGKIYLKLDYVL